MNVLEVENLKKEYPSFALKSISFALEGGKITGFIGRNGAGKTTTLKSMLGFIKSSGSVRFFGKDFAGNENEIKQKLGFVAGQVNYYPSKKLKAITDVTKTFYDNFDDGAYAKYMKKFALDESKTPSELSAGMKVKYSLALALSHGAELLILDEPTSGLDPVSRDEVLDILNDLCRDGKTVFFSTHITSDLEKCADNIIYIKNGSIVADCNISEFQNGYKLVKFDDEPADKENLIGLKREKSGYSAIIKTNDVKDFMACEKATLDEIMVHIERGNGDE